ncbi:MAG: ribosome-associated translation inhibitor RaiA [Clostridia bacterium]|nr:ribosome-associated translation inhibitor RaiA [Clostridia bacterium]
MTYNLICKQIELSESSKEKLLAKLRKIDKFFGDSDDCKIVVSQQKDKMILEITILYKGFFIRAEARNEDLQTAADICLENLDRQIRKNKTRLEKNIRGGGFENYISVVDEPDDVTEDEISIIKRKRFVSKPMSPEEAVLQMNMLGHDFFVFANPETMETNIVYRRKDGKYGLIETE